MSNLYKISTIGYGLFAILGILGFFYFLFQRQYFIMFLSLIIIYVSIDNFFCGARAKKCGYAVHSHYAIPPFLKRTKNPNVFIKKGKK